MTKKRRLSHEENELWRWAMRHTRQLSRAVGGERKSAPAAPRLNAPRPVVVARAVGWEGSPPARPLSPAPASLLDPGLVRKLARGKRRIDAVLDLHGARQDEAHARLGRFIEEAAKRGNRTLLVITGKGSPAGSGGRSASGVLRRMAPAWLRQAPLAHFVSGFEQAHQRHGGAGAFYVVLRRNSRP